MRGDLALRTRNRRCPARNDTRCQPSLNQHNTIHIYEPSNNIYTLQAKRPTDSRSTTEGGLVGGVTVSTLDFRSQGREFHSRSGRYQVLTTTMGDCLRTGKPPRYITNIVSYFN